MFIRKKKHRSGRTSVIVVEKKNGVMKELATMGVSDNISTIESLVNQANDWIDREKARRHPRLDLFGEERQTCEYEKAEVERVLSNVSNILLNGEGFIRLSLFVIYMVDTCLESIVLYQPLGRE